ncbi:hypothetical protein BK764_22380 [Bacillus thuringiensis serovar israelensis]|uniref:Uncharacterized protein n=1 Tax=Bacillus thuringiensis HD-789 TaxID=1217737 RepID=A0A9W3JW41_BACTU|nr:hypothetical protein [Bacillus thuringiensis]AFQ30683.1 hypothetical protein BTF1_33021 [Bacillus thuringiensis HD-789]KRD81409.1 hypothetical protein ASE53_33505 [Bacillus sp. Root11]KRD83951.1 hypothetical protein ASE54_32995 [Bacillus sp. Root131]OTW74197.1 hypothetical protein BK707_00070 [Bacillus thuringiensis serovar coreanensis]OTZ53075.1 hypothetical protein BK764_22380 [Bacillus thuringiensis serovar israelensis]
MLAGGLGASPLDLNVTKYGVRILLRTIELVVRLVQLLVQVEQLNPVFGLFGLAKAKNQPKKVLQGQYQKEKAVALR